MPEIYFQKKKRETRHAINKVKDRLLACFPETSLTDNLNHITLDIAILWVF